MTTKVNRLKRPYYRNGPSHRDGADVSFADIRKLFGFKTIQIGKWVTAKEQQLAANLFFDALYDLMEILAVPEDVIALNGSLSLGFGVGGQKYSAAHYDANARQLALAKNAGGGALAHEWFHAFDHYMSSRVFAAQARLNFASQSWLEDAELIAHPLNQRLSDFFQQLFLSNQGADPHPYILRSAEADRALGCYYYAQPQELAARAFEAIIQTNSLRNSFLVQGTQQSAEAKLGIYPDSEHLQTLSPLLYGYFALLGKAVIRSKVHST